MDTTNKKYQRQLERIRKAEAMLSYATPKQAGKLTEKIVKWKTDLNR